MWEVSPNFCVTICLPPCFPSTGCRYVVGQASQAQRACFLVSPVCVWSIPPWNGRLPFLYCSHLGTMSEILDNKKRPIQHPVTGEYSTQLSAQQDESPIVNRKYPPDLAFRHPSTVP